MAASAHIFILFDFLQLFFFSFFYNDKLNTALHCLNKKCEVINREINALGAKQQVGKEEIRVKLKLYETCPIPALLYGYGCSFVAKLN